MVAILNENVPFSNVVHTDMVIIFGNYIQNGLLVVSFFEWNNCFTSGDMNDVSEKIV